MNIPAYIVYKGYRAKVHYSVEDSIVIGEILGIHDSLSFYLPPGTMQEIVDMFHQCIENYFGFCAEMGKAPEVPIYSN